MSKFSWWVRACGVLLLWAAAAVALPAQTTAGIPPAPTFATLHRFSPKDGGLAIVGLIQATDGNFYGALPYYGGFGEGAIFKITPSGKLKTLHNFCSQNSRHVCPDGARPFAALVQGTDGNFYGITVEGGASTGDIHLCGGIGCGTIFKITTKGILTTLYNFCAQVNSGVCTDGSEPVAGLVQAADGNLYGTTIGGGHDNREVCYSYSGCGTVFTITPIGALTTLHRFDGADGANPEAALVQTTDGIFYSTTDHGGANGGGTVFKMDPRGELTTIYSFCSQSNCADGSPAQGALVHATNGNFYGTTKLGGVCNERNGCGTVFSMTPSGDLTTLFTFGHGGHGANPSAGLIQATDGNLYGTTFIGRTPSTGTVFKITPNGKLTTIHNFCSYKGNCYAGGNPEATLVQGTNGTFYGVTNRGGGGQNLGTVFSLSVGLGPFVETRPTFGEVGKSVEILGTNLTDATSVTFNGTAATFTVVSTSEITTTVPTGATTGTVQVVTPGGTLSSNVPFTVN
jgi:uncharacterized repeat protein (TIGR03803 family)